MDCETIVLNVIAQRCEEPIGQDPVVVSPKVLFECALSRLRAVGDLLQQLFRMVDTH
ncbi:hypothetical protein D3C71_1748150 [compost metagenome]